MSVVVRFAPSPTGYLHIGGARTALFNWLFARHHGGKFFLRIEDTDRERATPGAVEAIFESMKWLGLDWDGKPVFQFSRAQRHAEVAHQLLKEGKAYKCFSTPEEVEAMREEARNKGLPPRYNGFWRDRDPNLAPPKTPFVIRFKAPQEGETVIQDLVQGEVKLQNNQLDDMVLLRADGTPTYMLSVVVDDKDMGITHIIRGDDHLTNAFRQHHLYKVCGWETPLFAHIPLIHGPDGAKLSKRHGALGAQEYKDMGLLPEAMCNYLLRLGWSHGDEEIIPRERAIELFNLESVGRSPARFDMAKLLHLNAHYIREADNERLAQEIEILVNAKIKTSPQRFYTYLVKGMDGLKERAKTLLELAHAALIYDDVQNDDESASKFRDEDCKVLVSEYLNLLGQIEPFSHELLLETAKNLSLQKNIKLGALAQPLRVAITGRTVSPGIFEVMEVLGREETLRRLVQF